MHQQEEQSNERFFESNTLYKKELKQKQRDILSSSSTNTSISCITQNPSLVLQTKSGLSQPMSPAKKNNFNSPSQSQLHPGPNCEFSKLEYFSSEKR